MPTFDYRCDDCGGTYDVFHKVHEIVEDVVCPDCSSARHTRLISAPHITVSGKGERGMPSENFGGPCCGGGMCAMN